MPDLPGAADGPVASEPEGIAGLPLPRGSGWLRRLYALRRFRRSIPWGAGHDPSLPYLETVFGQDRWYLLHILVCRRCRRKAKNVLLETRLQEWPWLAPVFDRPPSGPPERPRTVSWPSQ